MQEDDSRFQEPSRTQDLKNKIGMTAHTPYAYAKAKSSKRWLEKKALKVAFVMSGVLLRKYF